MGFIIETISSGMSFLDERVIWFKKDSDTESASERLLRHITEDILTDSEVSAINNTVSSEISMDEIDGCTEFWVDYGNGFSSHLRAISSSEQMLA